MHDVTAIVCTFLRDSYLFNCVHSLKQSYPDIRILVADDGHTSDEKEQQLAALGVERYIRLPFNVGLAVKRNALLTLVSTPFILVGDDDFTYTPACRLQDLQQLMDTVDLAGGAVFENRILRQYEATFERQIDGGIWYRDIERDYRCNGSVRFAPCDLTFNFFIAKTDTARSVGGWDERIKICYEHEDFFLSLHQHGTKVAYCPDSVVQHKTLNIPNTEEYAHHRGNSADQRYFFEKWELKYVQDQQGRRLLPRAPETKSLKLTRQLALIEKIQARRVAH
jgi:GT2 family glycosyltransferase